MDEVARRVAIQSQVLEAKGAGPQQSRLVAEVASFLPEMPTFHVQDSACDLVDAARVGLAGDTRLHPQFMVALTGVVVFDRPMPCGPVTDSTTQAVAWITGKEGTAIVTIARDHLDGDRWGVQDIITWTFEQGLEENLDHYDHESSPVTRAMIVADRSLWLAVNLLLTQGGLLEQEPTVVDRATRRRWQRANRREPDVRVVRLRTSHGHSAGTGRHLSKRFVVRGHWRNQAYGPLRQLRRPMWINPHIKGPDDAPLDARETVYVFGTKSNGQA